MKFKPTIIMAAIISAVAVSSCNNSTSTSEKTTEASTSSAAGVNIKEEAVTYSIGNTNYKGYVTYDSNQQGKRPGIVIVHEWWGLTDYPRSRAKQLAELGYIAMAADMYGEGKLAADPKEAMALATPFYKDPSLCKTGLDAAISKLKSFSQTDAGKMAAIGYCYGGYVVLNAAKLGADLKGVVSFHGGLAGAKADKSLLKAKILVCHGAADQFESPEEIKNFKHGMDSISADYTFKVYDSATHAFTNPGATALGQKFNMPIKYNAAADSASWKDMKAFFDKIFK